MVTCDMLAMNISYLQVKLIIVNGWKTRKSKCVVSKSRRYCKENNIGGFCIYVGNEPKSMFI